jgi:hypothetical protein
MNRHTRTIGAAFTLAAAVSALAAGSANATPNPFYQVLLNGETINADGTEGPAVGLASDPPDAVPVRLGVTKTNWQVGGNAVAVHGGTAESNIQMGPKVFGQSYAQTLTAQSVVLFQITLDGSGSDAFVPVEIKANGSISWTQDGGAEALFAMNGPSGQIIRDDIDQNDPGKARLAGNDVFSVDTIVDLVPGFTYGIELAANVFSDVRNFQANPDGSFAFGEDSAIVDPTFTIDPRFASRWKIDGIPVDTTPHGVPEPATWAMLIAGFGLAGASLRRRQARIA